MGLVVVATFAAACGDDGKPDRTVAFLRTSAIAEASQDALLAELEAEGWTVGDNLTLVAGDVDEVYEDGDAAGAVIDAWVEDGVDLIIALSTPSGLAAKNAELDIPVLAIANDPVASGIVANPREPDANITGLSFRVPPDRTLDVARQLGNDISTVGLLWPADDMGAEPIREGIIDAAASLGVDLVDASFVGPEGVADAVGALVAGGAQVVVLANASATVRAIPEIEAATTAAGLPVVANIESNTFAVAILAPDMVETYRQVGRQAARLLDGTDVSEVPVEDPGRFRLTLRTAIADQLEIDLPDDLLQQAHEVSD